MFDPLGGLGGTGWLAEKVGRRRKHEEEPAPPQAAWPEPDAPVAPPAPREDDAVGDAVRKRLKKFLKDDGDVVPVTIDMPNGRAFGNQVKRQGARSG